MTGIEEAALIAALAGGAAEAGAGTVAVAAPAAIGAGTAAAGGLGAAEGAALGAGALGAAEGAGAGAGALGAGAALAPEAAAALGPAGLSGTAALTGGAEAGAASGLTAAGGGAEFAPTAGIGFTDVAPAAFTPAPEAGGGIGGYGASGYGTTAGGELGGGSNIAFAPAAEIAPEASLTPASEFGESAVSSPSLYGQGGFGATPTSSWPSWLTLDNAAKTATVGSLAGTAGKALVTPSTPTRSGISPVVGGGDGGAKTTGQGALEALIQRIAARRQQEQRQGRVF